MHPLIGEEKFSGFPISSHGNGPGNRRGYINIETNPRKLGFFIVLKGETI